MGQEQLIQAEIAEPSGIRWTFSNSTRCGLKAFHRPCQLQPTAEMQDTNFPGNAICASRKEYVFVVEDDADLRAALVETIEEMGYRVIGCSTAVEFERRFSEASTGCVLLDIKLPGGDGISMLERLQLSEAALRTVMMTGLSDAAVAADCMKIGAVEYLVKPVNEMTLRRAVDRAVGLSRVKHCRTESQHLVSGMLDRLTAAEANIAEMLARGFSTKMIAGELGRSENTVKIHRHRVMSKLKISSVASLANLYNHTLPGGM
jgi:FixJ family two-component response regulator